MNELLKINYSSDTPTVSGRELHKALCIETPYRIWFPRMSEYGFSEGADYTPYIFVHPLNRQETTDHELTVPMAKEIAMLQRNEKGKQIRQYLIRLEEAWNTPEMVISRALKLADGKIKLLESDNAELSAKIERDRPKVLFADAVDASDGTCLIVELAKMIKGNGVDMGQNRLFERMRQDGYLIRRQGTDYNMPTQRSMELGLFKIKETAVTHSDGHVTINRTPKVTGKGQIYFINKYCGKQGCGNMPSSPLIAATKPLAM